MEQQMFRQRGLSASLLKPTTSQRSTERLIARQRWQSEMNGSGEYHALLFSFRPKAESNRPSLMGWDEDVADPKAARLVGWQGRPPGRIIGEIRLGICADDPDHDFSDDAAADL